ncbi:Vacuolar protein sorting-associated protein 41 [Neurospora sp. IMI 360204]|nr:Vacuolar protein sorting-associated protein 41 [Neurospora sp. IMI 360204]
MNKPKFIRALLEEVGTAVNPITLVRRIPEGLQIPGLREGIRHIMKEHEIQYSIFEGVSRVLRSEVAVAMNTLRNGQRKGVKFEVGVKACGEHVDVQPTDIPTQPATKKQASSGVASPAVGVGQQQQQPPPTPSTPTFGKPKAAAKKYQAGHCAQCLSPFTTYETDTLVGFACGHVFHLPHLLEALNPGKSVDVDALLGGTGAEERSVHLVGAKVTHARLLGDRIVGGVCGL